MSGARGREAILSDRLGTVLALTEANAEEARARAGLGGAEITTLSAEEGTDRESAEAAEQQAEARDRLDAARARIAELEAELATLDRELGEAED